MEFSSDEDQRNTDRYGPSRKSSDPIEKSQMVWAAGTTTASAVLSTRAYFSSKRQ